MSERHQRIRELIEAARRELAEARDELTEAERSYEDEFGTWLRSNRQYTINYRYEWLPDPRWYEVYERGNDARRRVSDAQSKVRKLKAQIVELEIDAGRTSALRHRRPPKM